MLASDAFFPFSWGDSVEIACQAGVGAIVHPGGSVRDQDAIDCCNKVRWRRVAASDGWAGARPAQARSHPPPHGRRQCTRRRCRLCNAPVCPLIPPHPDPQYGVVLMTTGVRHFKH